MTRNNSGPACRAIPQLPAALLVCMLLGAAIFAKSGYPFMAIGSAAGLQVLYPVVVYAKQVIYF
jgi:hypothetical protein